MAHTNKNLNKHRPLKKQYTPRVKLEHFKGGGKYELAPYLAIGILYIVGYISLILLT